MEMFKFSFQNHIQKGLEFQPLTISYLLYERTQICILGALFNFKDIILFIGRLIFLIFITLDLDIL
jgi:hypothetical protein